MPVEDRERYRGPAALNPLRYPIDSSCPDRVIGDRRRLKCKRHIQWTERILTFWLLLVALSVISGFTPTAFTGRWLLGLSGLSLLALCSSFVAWLLILIVRSRRQVNCWGLTRSVVYLGSNGSCHSFDIKSRFYAAEFVRANPRKLVNASVEVASILRNTEYGKFQIPTRVLRKREH